MEREEIQSKWKILIPDGTSGFKSLRISSTCIPDLYIGIDSHNLRCLILKLPSNHKVDFRSIIKENISLQLYEETHWIVLKLLNLNYIDIFDDLVLSFYNSIKDISNSRKYTEELISAFHKWSEFFDESILSRLTLEIVQGLFGELVILQRLVSEAPSINLNTVLTSWTGPYGKAHDFCLDNYDYEIKTKETNKTYVHIASEYQLENQKDKALYLKIISVVINSDKAIPISTLVTKIKDQIIFKNGDIHLFLKALKMKNLNLQNIHEYDDFRFEVKTEITYDCLLKGFPKLISPNIPPDINKLSYNLRSDLPSEFITEIKQY